MFWIKWKNLLVLSFLDCQLTSWFVRLKIRNVHCPLSIVQAWFPAVRDLLFLVFTRVYFKFLTAWKNVFKNQISSCSLVLLFSCSPVLLFFRSSVLLFYWWTENSKLGHLVHLNSNFNQNLFFNNPPPTSTTPSTYLSSFEVPRIPPPPRNLKIPESKKNRVNRKLVKLFEMDVLSICFWIF